VSEGQKVRVGLIGVGKHARHVLLPAIGCVDDLELAGLCVRTERTRAALAAEYDVPVVPSYRDLLARDDVDAVIVATPSALHRYLVMDAVRCGKHVLCEAPGIVSELDVAQVADAQRGRSAVVQYGHRFWYAPVYQALAAAARDFGTPGERTIRVAYPEALHLYGITLMAIGPIAAVEAHGAEHDCTYEVEFANGDTGVFEPLAGETDAGRMAERVEITSAGERLVADAGATLQRIPADGEPTVLERFDFDPAYAQDHTKLPDGSDAARKTLRERGYTTELESFVKCIRSGEAPRVGVAEAGAVFRLVWAMFESVGVGRRVAVAPASEGEG